MHARGFAVVLTLFALVSGRSTFAADPAPPALSAADQALVQTAASYIQTLKGAEGRFRQTDAKGQVSSGVFYMLRPGKARFQYDPPAQLLVVADGSNVSVYDRKLKSFEQYPLAQTPLVLLLTDKVKLDQGVAILAVDRRRDGFIITAGDVKRRVPGRLALRFSQSPLTLTGWTLIDAQGQKTDVRLSGLKQRTRFAPSLFSLSDPRLRDPANVTN